MAFGDDYIEVGQRVAAFAARYPDGSIQCPPNLVKVRTIGDKTFIGVTAYVYRTPDDKRPGIASAWEPFPGKTSFTRDSEYMNAETSAMGRALSCMGIETKRSIASANEVRARRADRQGSGAAGGGEAPAAPALDMGRAVHDPLSEKQRQMLEDRLGAYSTKQVRAFIHQLIGRDTVQTKGEATKVIEALMNGARPEAET